MKRRKRWAATPLGVGAVWALLLGMVTLAVNVGVFGLGPLRGPASLDYSAPPLGRFQPLRDRFIADVLGSPTGSSAEARGPAPRGGFVLHAENVTHALTNDSQAQAYEIDSVPFTGRSDTAAATRERSEPSSCEATGSTVWYRYRATGTGLLVAKTVASYDSSLAIYIAPAGRNASAIGCDHDTTGLTRLTFSAFRGTVYLFQVTARTQGGKLAFSLEPPRRATTVYGEHTRSSGTSYDYGYPQISADGRYVVFDADPAVDPRCAPRAKNASPCGVRQSFIRDLKRGTTALVSLTSTGGVPDSESDNPQVSADGRYVTFQTNATNVTADPDANDPMTGASESDVFRRDRLLGITERVTIAADGHELNGADGSISEDGRYVAFAGDFEHRINGLHPNYPIADIYIKDMVTGLVTLASAGNHGERGNHDSIIPQISPDGSSVVFWTRATNLSPESVRVEEPQTPEVYLGRVYVDDLRTHHLSFECVPEGKTASTDHCYAPSISAGGRYSLFWSDATDLVPGAPSGGTPTHPIMNLYLRDRRTGHLEIVNVTDNGTPVGDKGERQTDLYRASRLYRPWVSADGSVVAFDSNAPLAPGDRNGLVDAYVRDRIHQRTIRASETPDGGDPNGQSVFPHPTGDASTVAFLSEATNLVAGTAPGWNVFVCRWRIP